MEYEDFEEKTMKRQSLYKGKIIEVALDQVTLPNGRIAKRELVFHPGAVAILAVTPQEQLVLVEQFRKPLEKVTLEIPAGKIEPTDQNPRDTARRELEEETGLRGHRLERLAEFATSPGFSNEIIYLYEAHDLVAVKEPKEPDADELLNIRLFTLAEAKEAIARGEVYDAKTIIAIQYWELSQRRRFLEGR